MARIDVTSQSEYQVHARLVLLDTGTGSRSQYPAAVIPDSASEIQIISPAQRALKKSVT